MIDQKHTGSYYTPKILSDFLVQHIFKKYIELDNISILEPSSGDGMFVSSLSNLVNDRNLNIDIVDINNKELCKAKNLVLNNMQDQGGNKYCHVECSLGY